MVYTFVFGQKAMERSSNETFLAILLHSTVRFSVYSKMKFEIFLI